MKIPQTLTSESILEDVLLEYVLFISVQTAFSLSCRLKKKVRGSIFTHASLTGCQRGNFIMFHLLQGAAKGALLLCFLDLGHRGAGGVRGFPLSCSFYSLFLIHSQQNMIPPSFYPRVRHVATRSVTLLA